MTTPVLITAFRRPDFLKLVLDCFESRSNPIYVWLNGPFDLQDEKNIQDCLTVIDKSLANVVLVNSNSEHFASGQSIINAIDWIFTLESCAIILEDDIVVGEDFIDFMDASIEHFKSPESGVGSIVGSCFVPPELRSTDALRKTVFTSSWGWGTWKDRWSKFDRDLSNWNEKLSFFPPLLQDIPSRSRFNSIFMSIKLGRFDAWDYRWQFTNWKQQWITIAPNSNLIMNIGFDSRATHTFSTPSWLPKTVDRFSVKSLDFSSIPYDELGDKWYKSNVLGLTYSYFLRTRIRHTYSRFRRFIMMGKIKHD